MSNLLSYLYWTVKLFFFPPKKKKIPFDKLALNSFFNMPQFGHISEQGKFINDSMNIQHCRVLFAWHEAIQPSMDAEAFFGFYDDIVEKTPANMKLLVVLTGLPNWVYTSKHSPDVLFVEQWVEKVVERYKNSDKIIGYQLFNEPNAPADMFPENVPMLFDSSPEAYVNFLELCYNTVKRIDPSKMVVNAATTSVMQNYPDTLQYNKDMIDHGLLNFTDVFCLHYYTRKSTNFYRRGGVKDFIKNYIPEDIEVWLTETGTQDPSETLEFAERHFKMLSDEIPQLTRMYLYIFGSNKEHGFGLLTWNNDTQEVEYSSLARNIFNRVIYRDF